MLIYVIRNRVNGKLYVGRTERTFEARWKGHLHAIARGSRLPLYRAIRRDGVENFSIIVQPILFESVDLLNDCEIREIARLQTKDRKRGYNLTDGGEGSSGHVHSPEAIEKQRSKVRGRKHSPEELAKMKGRKKSDEHRAKISATLKGRGKGKKHSSETLAKLTGMKRSPEQCANNSAAQKGKKLSLETRAKIGAAGKGRKKSDKERAKLSAANRISSHLRWHVRRGIVNPKRKLCASISSAFALPTVEAVPRESRRLSP